MPTYQNRFPDIFVMLNVEQTTSGAKNALGTAAWNTGSPSPFQQRKDFIDWVLSICPRAQFIIDKNYWIYGNTGNTVLHDNTVALLDFIRSRGSKLWFMTTKTSKNDHTGNLEERDPSKVSSLVIDPYSAGNLNNWWHDSLVTYVTYLSGGTRGKTGLNGSYQNGIMRYRPHYTTEFYDFSTPAKQDRLYISAENLPPNRYLRIECLLDYNLSDANSIYAPYTPPYIRLENIRNYDGNYSDGYTNYVNWVPKANARVFNALSGWIVGTVGLIGRSLNNETTGIHVQNSTITTTINDVYFFDDLVGFAVGDSGKILRTVNGGNTWVQITSPVVTNLNCISFFSSSVGVIGGNSGVILKTTDGGLTWVQKTTDFINAIYDVQCVTSTMAIAVGGFGKCVKSIDTGETWVNKPSGVANTITAINMVSSTIGLMVGTNKVIRKTADGGETWVDSSNNAPNVTYFDIKCITSTYYIAVGTGGTIIKSINSGGTWTSINNSGVTQSLNAVYFLENIGGLDYRYWVAGDNGTLLYSESTAASNLNATWTVMNTGRAENFKDVFFTNKNFSGTVTSVRNKSYSWWENVFDSNGRVMPRLHLSHEVHTFDITKINFWIQITNTRVLPVGTPANQEGYVDFRNFQLVNHPITDDINEGLMSNVFPMSENIRSLNITANVPSGDLDHFTGNKWCQKYRFGYFAPPYHSTTLRDRVVAGIDYVFSAYGAHEAYGGQWGDEDEVRSGGWDYSVPIHFGSVKQSYGESAGKFFGWLNSYRKNTLGDSTKFMMYGDCGIPNHSGKKHQYGINWNDRGDSSYGGLSGVIDTYLSNGGTSTGIGWVDWLGDINKTESTKEFLKSKGVDWYIGIATMNYTEWVEQGNGSNSWLTRFNFAKEEDSGCKGVVLYADWYDWDQVYNANTIPNIQTVLATFGAEQIEIPDPPPPPPPPPPPTDTPVPEVRHIKRIPGSLSRKKVVTETQVLTPFETLFGALYAIFKTPSKTVEENATRWAQAYLQFAKQAQDNFPGEVGNNPIFSADTETILIHDLITTFSNTDSDNFIIDFQQAFAKVWVNTIFGTSIPPKGWSSKTSSIVTFAGNTSYLSNSIFVSTKDLVKSATTIANALSLFTSTVTIKITGILNSNTIEINTVPHF